MGPSGGARSAHRPTYGLRALSSSAQTQLQRTPLRRTTERRMNEWDGHRRRLAGRSWQYYCINRQNSRPRGLYMQTIRPRYSLMQYINTAVVAAIKRISFSEPAVGRSFFVAIVCEIAQFLRTMLLHLNEAVGIFCNSSFETYEICCTLHYIIIFAILCITTQCVVLFLDKRLRYRRDSARQRELRRSRSFKPFQGQWCWFQSKARIRFTISE